MKEMVGGCCVCSDDRGWPENPLVYCDGQSCTVAVHQACYGIVTVPTGPWYCRKCESQERSVKVKCELCPSKYGALKRTDNSGWAHVVCALYIPEVRFGNVTTMEPIQLQLIPSERFNKVCYICEENKKPANATVGACMQCNKFGCKQQFHVTCAQSLGLLCEEAGNYFDNVKYCGYCQHHYSKLKKGGNVKTIPPYKPISTDNHHSDSNSEKETDSSAKSKRKSSVNNKTVSKVTSSSSSASSNTKSSTTYQKSSSSTKSADSKAKSSSSSAKSAKNTEVESVSAESEKFEKKETPEVSESSSATSSSTKDNNKESGTSSSSKGKKRKANSRTPTPNTVTTEPPPAPIVPPTTSSETATSSTAPPPPATKKESPSHVTLDKTKKIKVDQIPHTATVTLPTVTPSTSSSVVLGPTSVPSETATTPAQPDTAVHTPAANVNSVVVSVPLHNTHLSPKNQLPPSTPAPSIIEEKPLPIEDKSMITSEITSGGLKITYEKQVSSIPIPMDIDETAQSNDIPIKRTRSESSEKSESKPGRGAKKKGSNGVLSSVSNLPSKRGSRSQHNTPPPQPSTFTPQQIKDSPPSSPSSESLGAPPTISRKKGRKPLATSAQPSTSGTTMTCKDSKENIKLFQNGVNAPHMLGNQLNLNSNMAQKMSDHLNSELEAHSIFSSSDSVGLVGPQLHHRVIASARSNSAGGSSTASGGSGLSSMLGGSGGAIPQTLDQLLERQWEQGSQFLMEQAQHFDIASLLSCLHQLRAENLRLEEHVNSLLQRRDHLLAVNARLAIPLTGAPVAPQSSHPHTVNNIHPAVAASHGEATRPRHTSGYPPHIQSIPPGAPIENGISPEQAYSHSHRSPVVSQPQPSPNISNSGMMRQTPDPAQQSQRAPIRPHNYSMYQSSSSVQQQMLVRRDGDQMHQNPTKPS